MGINFKDIGQNSGGDFTPLPENRYNVKVEKAEVKKASTGTTMISTEFVITDGDFKGRKLWNNFTLTPKAYVYLYNFLKSAGSDMISNEDVDENQVAADMVGLTASAFVEPRTTTNGNPTNVMGKFSTVTEDSALFT
tara:strand:- start:167 stop:577 length:411 start_codon:yes stop_codon:yes gene_type:complete